MTRRPLLLLPAAALALACALPAAAEPVKIGMITTLSTGAGYLGEDVRDGFLLAMKEEGGRLGGTDVELIVEDDGLNPGTAKQLADRLLEQEKVELMTGVIFSNIAPVVAPLTIRSGGIYISPNAAPSTFAGKNCDQDYFAVAWQNDSLHETAGIYANELGYKSAYLIAPNYQAGKDSIAGFKRYFKGEIKGELFTKLGQTDYAAEIAKLRAADPEMLFTFLPGGMGINFLKQYSQAGLTDQIPLVGSIATMDPRIIAAIGDAALGVRSSSHWNADLDNPANKAFVANFTETYGRPPTPYASQGYDTARLIASALKATGGKVVADKDAFRAALRAGKFDSVRGSFAFNNNQHPINDWYGLVVEKGADGAPVNRTVKMIAPGHEDAYAAECALQ
ncbi:MAG: ABC transporter substrate-binding protein [Sneathiellaceae bacterium]